MLTEQARLKAAHGQARNRIEQAQRIIDAWQLVIDETDSLVIAQAHARAASAEDAEFIRRTPIRTLARETLRMPEKLREAEAQIESEEAEEADRRWREG